MVALMYIYMLFFIVCAIVLLVYDLFEKKRTSGIKIAAAFALGIFILYMQHANILLLAPGILLFYFVGKFYGTAKDVPVALLCIAYVLIAGMYVQTWFLAQVAMLGLAAGTHLIGKHTHRNRNDRKRETNRDFLQIFFGVLLMAVFYLTTLQKGEVVVLVFVLLGYLLADYVAIAGKNVVSNILRDMERDNTALGEGAIMLAIGTLIAISILHSSTDIILVFAALYIGDSVATIIGINFGRTKLPYNDHKSVLGAISCFVVVAAIAYPLIGISSLLFGLVAAFAESFPTTLDDNLFVAIILVFLLLL